MHGIKARVDPTKEIRKGIVIVYVVVLRQLRPADGPQDARGADEEEMIVKVEVSDLLPLVLCHHVDDPLLPGAEVPLVHGTSDVGGEEEGKSKFRRPALDGTVPSRRIRRRDTTEESIS